jgi:hypothetical protein
MLPMRTVLFGELYYQPAQDHPEGAMRDIYEWDTGKFLGQIPQPPHLQRYREYERVPACHW